MPNYFKKDWLEDWKNERKMGKTRYVFIHGFLFIIIAALVDAFLNDRAVWEMPFIQAAQTVLLYFAGGLGYGLFTWWFNERKFNKPKK